MADPAPHMTPDEFRRQGTELVEWIASYMERLEDLPVLAQVEPGWVRAQLPDHPPAEGEPWPDIVADLDRVIVPGLTHWQSPNFFAYFPGNATGPSILGDLLSAGLGVQGMLWATSPACTELEQLVLDWLLELTGLPQRFSSKGPGGGVIQESASSANLCALRDLAVRRGAEPARLRAYVSTQTHSSVEKAARVAGLAPRQLEAIDVGPDYAMLPDALARAMAADAAAGLAPCFVAATVGTTSSTALDPVPAIAEVARAHGAWVHVDAAFAGSAAVCPELRFVNDGADVADSWCFNPHKWLLTNFDCSALWVADRAPLLAALSVTPEYLRNASTDAGAVVDYRDWQIPLGRRFRALKLWFVIRHYGAAGLAAHIRSGVALGQELAAWVEADERFELAAPAPLSLVCLRHREGDEATQTIIDAVNGSGHAYVTHTRLDDRLVLRVAIGQARTERRHVEALWEQITALA